MRRNSEPSGSFVHRFSQRKTRYKNQVFKLKAAKEKLEQELKIVNKNITSFQDEFKKDADNLARHLNILYLQDWHIEFQTKGSWGPYSDEWTKPILVGVSVITTVSKQKVLLSNYLYPLASVVCAYVDLPEIPHEFLLHSVSSDLSSAVVGETCRIVYLRNAKCTLDDIKKLRKDGKANFYSDNFQIL